MVTNEEYITNQCIESVTQPDVNIRVLTSKGFLNLSLCVIRWTHLVSVAPYVFHILLSYLVGMLTEDAVEYPISNEWLSEEFFLPVQTVAFYLLTTHTECWSELTEQSVYRMNWNLPDTEEAKYVVDTISIKVLRHVLEAIYPPLTTVLYHLVPVVSRETPVLTIHREVIRWSTRLTVKVEVTWFCPYVTAIAIDTNRNVTLEDYLMSLCVFVYCFQLTTQNELYVIEESNLLVSLVLRVRQCLAVSLIPLLMVWPVREIGCSELISHIRILCVRYKPTLCLSKEFLESTAFEYLSTLLFKEQTEVFCLCIVHTLIVNLWQCVKLFT